MIAVITKNVHVITLRSEEHISNRANLRVYHATRTLKQHAGENLLQTKHKQGKFSRVGEKLESSA